MVRKIIRIVAVLALACFALILGEWGYHYYYDHRKPNFEHQAVVYVYPDMSPATLVDSIAARAGVRNRESLARAFQKGSAPRPGRYVVEASMSSYALMRKMAAGWEDEMNLTVAPVFRTVEDLAGRVGPQLMIGQEAVLAALKDPAFLARYGMDTVSVLGYIVPDTYRIRWSVDVDGLFERLLREYHVYWDGAREELALRQGLSPRQAATLASIVNEETKHQPEMARVAGVYLNRFHRGMLLQADPTVAYCFGYTLKRVLNKHLSYDSPYNTYKYAGLPPGPISCAPKACIEAVLHPEGEDLYFCASPELNGTHRFARTLAEHNRNADAYRRALGRAGK